MSSSNLKTSIEEQEDFSSFQANRYRSIRQHAKRVLNASQIPKECFCCKYNKHVECCHKKAISSFNPDTLISIVNHIDNLVWLCPNCHWEFDNGILSF